ncbi:MAG: hypothetical protein AB7U51_04520 [Arcobacter sp.]|uniref:hypothetical protein n=1 Tax=Arcobacter sp. TaxID=1872629 RepID=UPI003D08D0FE
MARPSIYNLDMLKQAYESGISKDEICTKYKIAKNILTNKINKDGWTIKCDINNDIIEFGAKLNAITQNYKDNSLMQEVIIDKLQEIKINLIKIVGKNNYIRYKILITNQPNIIHLYNIDTTIDDIILLIKDINDIK